MFSASQLRGLSQKLSVWLDKSHKFGSQEEGSNQEDPKDSLTPVNQTPTLPGQNRSALIKTNELDVQTRMISSDLGEPNRVVSASVERFNQQQQQQHQPSGMQLNTDESNQSDVPRIKSNISRNLTIARRARHTGNPKFWDEEKKFEATSRCKVHHQQPPATNCCAVHSSDPNSSSKAQVCHRHHDSTYQSTDKILQTEVKSRLPDDIVVTPVADQRNRQPKACQLHHHQKYEQIHHSSRPLKPELEAKVHSSYNHKSVHDCRIEPNQRNHLVNEEFINRRVAAQNAQDSTSMKEFKGRTTIKFFSQLYFLIHISVILSLLIHHKIILNNEKRSTIIKESSESNDGSIFKAKYIVNNDNTATQRSSIEPAKSMSYSTSSNHLGLDDRPSSPSSSDDVLIRLFGYWIARRILQYLAFYLLASSCVILVLLRISRFFSGPALEQHIETLAAIDATQDGRYYRFINGLGKCKSILCLMNAFIIATLPNPKLTHIGININITIRFNSDFGWLDRACTISTGFDWPECGQQH